MGSPQIGLAPETGCVVYPTSRDGPGNGAAGRQTKKVWYTSTGTNLVRGGKVFTYHAEVNILPMSGFE